MSNTGKSENIFRRCGHLNVGCANILGDNLVERFSPSRGGECGAVTKPDHLH